MADKPAELTGEISALPPEEASKVAAEIRAVAELRGVDTDVADLVELQKTGPIPTVKLDDEDALSAEELRDAWPLLDLEERSDGLRVLPRDEAEDFFIALSASDQAALLVHFRSGQRRQWMRLLEPDDAADVIQEAGDEHRDKLLALLDAPTRKEVAALLAYEEDEAGGLMSTRYARLRPTMTADEAISYLRRQAVGRLDLDSEGLLLLTDDGSLAEALLHPSTGIVRRYEVRVRPVPDARTMRALRAGGEVEGVRVRPRHVVLEGSEGGEGILSVEITEGRKREIRVLAREAGLDVERLVRVAFGPVRLGPLRPGATRPLKHAEVAALREAAARFHRPGAP